MARGDYRHLTSFRVRFADLDAMGHMNNIAVLQLLETARVDYMVDLGLAIERELTYALVALQCDFRSQAFYGEVLTCGTRAARLGRSSFVLEHEIWKADDSTVAVGSGTMVTLGEDTTKSAPMPQAWRDRLEEFEQRPL